MTNTCDITVTLLSQNIHRPMPLLSDKAVIAFSLIVVLIARGQLLDCATIACSEQCVLKVQVIWTVTL